MSTEFIEFYNACRYGDLITLIKLMKNVGIRKDAKTNIGIQLASEYGRLDIVKYLVDKGCNPRADNNRAIQWASYYGHLEVVKYLVSIGCDPKADKDWSIIFASQNGYLEVVKYLVSVGCDPKSKDNYSILWASRNCHLEVVKYLLEIGCDHKDVKIEYNLASRARGKQIDDDVAYATSYKYEALQDLKIRLLTLLNKAQENNYIKTQILKRIIPCFTEHQIIGVL